MNDKKININPAILFLVIINLACSRLDSYDLVIRNVQYLSYETGNFQKGNIGITNGNISTISNERLSGKKAIDGTDLFLYPGFIDAHCHFLGYAKGLLEANLVGAKSEEEMLDRLRDFREKNPELPFILGRGWDQNNWGNQWPSHHSFSKEFPNTPVVLKRIDGHALLANEAAMAMVKVDTTVDGGKILKEGNGKPTGIFIDNAMSLFHEINNESNSLVSALQSAQQNCFAAGLTRLNDAGLSPDEILFLDSLYKMDALKIPQNIMVAHSDYNLIWLELRVFRLHENLKVRGIKIYADGALGSRGALLLEPYTDDPGQYGLAVTNANKLEEVFKKAKEKKWQVNVHAIGDSANRQVLKLMSKYVVDDNKYRWRIEHAQIVNPVDSIYFVNYGILPSVQPTHATSDMDWAEKRLGSERIHHAYSYQDLWRWSKGKMPLGTDFPVEDIDPLKTFYAAVARKDDAGNPENGFLPSQKLTRLQALKGMTTWAAYGQFGEWETGKIEKRMAADLVILNTNLLECNEEDILKSKVEYTISNGEIVYQSGQ